MSEEKLSYRAREALRHIRNAIMHFGRIPSMRELMSEMDYKSPRSAMLLMEELVEKGFLKRKTNGGYQLLRDLEEEEITRTVYVPLVGPVACGLPLLAHENIEAMIQVATSLAKPGSKYFLLRATGDSMNQAGIQDGDLVLVRQQQTADPGNLIVALIDDEATVKEFRPGKEVIILLPRSTKAHYKPIILHHDFLIQGVVIATIPKH